MTTPPGQASTSPTARRLAAIEGDRRGSVPVALLRMTLGVILLATWYGNLSDDLYTADGLKGFFDWLYASPEEGGNGSGLGFYESFLDSVIAPVAGLYATIQLIVELVMGIGLLIGAFTRLLSIAAAAFFFALFLAYVGGEEWIWTYVLLIATATTVFLGYGGRMLGVDRAIVTRHGDSPLGNLLW